MKLSVWKILFLTLIFSSCAKRNLKYFSDIETNSEFSAKIDVQSEIKIHSFDRLKISVNRPKAESTLLLNKRIIEYGVNEVISFREKYSKATSETYLNLGDFLWNSGMFCFKAGVHLGELKKYEPEDFAVSRKVFNNKNGVYLDKLLSLQIPSVSLDHAVMEAADNIKIFLSFTSNMGSFQAIYDNIPENNATISGKNLLLKTNKLVSFIGERTSYWLKPRMFLVLDKKNGQYIKEVYESPEKEFLNYLI